MLCRGSHGGNRDMRDPMWSLKKRAQRQELGRETRTLPTRAFKVVGALQIEESVGIHVSIMAKWRKKTEHQTE